MANTDQLKIIKAGAVAWNSWRFEHPEIDIDLRGADLRNADLNNIILDDADLKDIVFIGENLFKSTADLSGADFRGAYLNNARLRRADLRGANLYRAHLNNANLCNTSFIGANLIYTQLHDADLRGADLSGATLHEADLSRAHLNGANLGRADLNKATLNEADLSHARLNGADLREANLADSNLSGTDLSSASFIGADLSRARLIESNLYGANFDNANLSRVNLTDANLERAVLIKTNLTAANLEGCSVYGVSAWALMLDGANQKNLRITPDSEPLITVDNLEVAQLIYMMLNNYKVRNVINTITTKAVLILGRFTQERKAILDALRDELRQHDYLPIIFDFEQPSTRDLTETISTLAHLARFIIVDITAPRSVPQELQAIIPYLTSVPVKPLLLASENAYSMFEHFRKYPWVLATYVYENSEILLANIKEEVIMPAEAKANELRQQSG